MTILLRNPSVLVILLALVLSGTLSAEQSEPSPSPSQAPAAKAPLRVRVSQAVAVRMLEKRVTPEIPEEVRKKHMHVEGMVTLKIVISRDGDVSQVALVSGDPALAPSAIDAVKQWKYKPYLLDGQPVEVETTVQMNLSLNAK